MSTPQAELRRRLLDYYADLGRLDSYALESTAVRAESVSMRDVLAHAATGGRFDYPQLAQHLLERHQPAEKLILDPEFGARLASVVALQNTEGTDTAVAVALLEKTLPVLEEAGITSQRFHRLLAELYFDQRDFKALTAYLAENPGVRTYFHGYLPVDAQNPAVRQDRAGSAERKKWLAGFNRQFTDRGLIPVELEAGPGDPFNRLTTPPVHGPRAPGPKVTVIMTSFKPVREDILLSARSILAQTWQNLELLVVDDASPEEYRAVLDEIEALDERVQVIRLQTNGGTYAARNVGIAAAGGEFVTGQDADDWSHPQRIETQVNHLLRTPRCPGNQVYTVNMTADLVRVRRGYHPFIPSAPTLMVRTRIMRELGGYLSARKAADNEMRGRVASYAGAPVAQLRDPLIFMRILPDSLSRADFRPGWQHPARRAFWSAYRTWHATATRKQLQHNAAQPFPIHVPHRFTTPPQQPYRTDVVFAADWCEYGPLQVSMLEEISALRAAGLRVGVMHIETAQHLSLRVRRYCAPVQQLISDGDVASVLADEDFHQVRLLLIRAPEPLQFIAEQRAAFTPDQLCVVAERPAGEDPVTYLPEDCAQHAQRAFGRRPVWIAASETVRQSLQRFLPENDVADSLYRPPFDPDPYRVRRNRLRNTRPVIGRWAGSLPEHWPADPGVVVRLWPTDGHADIRLLGDPEAASQALGTPRLPAAWLSFQPGEIAPVTYYRSLDFYIHRTSSPATAPERGVLEALAAGCVVILPPEQEPIYGDAALYREPAKVPETVRAYTDQPEKYFDQSRRAASFSAGQTPDRFTREILRLLDAAAAQGRDRKTS